jgi:hypothetical protein
VPAVVAALVGYPVIAALLTGFQWLALRHEVDRAGWWILGHLGGLFAGFGVGFAIVQSLGNVLHLLEPIDYPSAKAFVLIGAVAGTVYGAVTWFAMAELRRRAAAGTAVTRVPHP